MTQEGNDRSGTSLHSVTVQNGGEELSRKFWSGGKIGPGDQNFRNIGPGGPFFPENFGPPVKISVRPASQVNSACCCFVRLIELDYYTMEDSCNKPAL